jgi:membrane protease YdiL (CAAX protease family)
VHATETSRNTGSHLSDRICFEGLIYRMHKELVSFELRFICNFDTIAVLSLIISSIFFSSLHFLYFRRSKETVHNNTVCISSKFEYTEFITGTDEKLSLCVLLYSYSSPIQFFSTFLFPIVAEKHGD